MNKQRQIYYHAVFGAFGGLVGWWLMGSFATQTWNIWLAAAFVGAGLGGCIGGFIASADGAMIKRVPARALLEGGIGMVSGGLAGLMGLLLAQGVWVLSSGGFVARAMVWMIMGLLIGVGDIVVSRRFQRTLYAMLGGLLGGVFGGLVYEGLTQLFLAHSGTVQLFVGGVGLIMVGASIGALIPLARQVLSHGELRVLIGEQSGLVREVTSNATIGRYDGNDLYLPDAGVSWRHAEVRRIGDGFELIIRAEAEQEAHVGTASVAPGKTHHLQSGDLIRIGEALIQFVGR